MSVSKSVCVCVCVYIKKDVYFPFAGTLTIFHHTLATCACRRRFITDPVPADGGGLLIHLKRHSAAAQTHCEYAESGCDQFSFLSAPGVQETDESRHNNQ